MLRIFCYLRAIAVFFFGLLPQTLVFADDACVEVVQRMLAVKHAASEDWSLSIAEVRSEWLKLERHPFSDLVSKMSPIGTDDIVAANRVDPATIDLVRETFKRLYSFEDRLAMNRGGRSFRDDWLVNNLEKALTRDVIQFYSDRAYTTGEVLRDLWSRWIIERESRTQGFFDRFFVSRTRHPLVVRVSRPMVQAADDAAKGMGKILKAALIAGPVAAGLSALVAGPMGATTGFLHWLGQKIFSKPTRALQGVYSQLAQTPQTFERVQRLASELDRNRFEGLSPDEAHKKWLELEKQFRLNQLETYKALTPDARDGRWLEKEAFIGVPNQFLSDLTSHNTNYEIHTARMESFEKELLSLEKEASPNQDRIDEVKERIRYHQDFREQALRNTSFVLASWAIFDFVYFEFTRPYKIGDVERNSAFQVIKKNSHFDLYITGIREQTQELLKELGYAIDVKYFADGLQTAAEKGAP